MEKIQIKLSKSENSGLDFFFTFQLDREANHLAAFTSKDCTDKPFYVEKYTKFLNDQTIHADNNGW
ncbi:MAG: hypothetical protein ABI784_09455 [Ginsengibacter sp.]